MRWSASRWPPNDTTTDHGARRDIAVSHEEIPEELLDVPGPPLPDVPMASRPIPASGELLPVIGLAVGPVFAQSSGAAKDSAREVLQVLRGAGGRLLDVPAHRPDAEALLGELSTAAGPGRSGLLAARVWSQLLLQWLLAHPAVGCVLPATHDPRHMLDNTRAGRGPLPDAAQRRQLAGLFA